MSRNLRIRGGHGNKAILGILTRGHLNTEIALFLLVGVPTGTASPPFSLSPGAMISFGQDSSIFPSLWVIAVHGTWTLKVEGQWMP